MKLHKLFLVIFVALSLVIGVEIAVYFFMLVPKSVTVQQGDTCIKPSVIPNSIDPHICQKIALYQRVPSNQLQLSVIQHGKLSLVAQGYIDRRGREYDVRFVTMDEKGGILQDYVFKKGELLVFVLKEGKRVEGKITDLREGQSVIVKTSETVKTFSSQPEPQITNEVTITTP